MDIIYDNVCLRLFRITKQAWENASSNIIENRISKVETARPNIDYKTGNIHPSKKIIANQNNGKIQQLVLCKGLGSHISQPKLDPDYYSSDTKRSKCA